MARIEQVIHVRGTDGVVQECALFDSSSDIPSTATAREFRLGGEKIYGAVLDEYLTGENDDDWLYDNCATPLAFHDGSAALHLLTTPYYIRPNTESLEFGADGGTMNFNDLLSTNGEYSMRYRCDYDGISVMDMETVYGLKWEVVCGENTSSEDIAFTLTLTFSFADGSTQDITLTGTQAAASGITVEPDTLEFDSGGGEANVTVRYDGPWIADDLGGLTIWRENGNVRLYEGELVVGDMTLRVEAPANTGTSDMVYVAVFAADDGGSEPATLTVTVKGAERVARTITFTFTPTNADLTVNGALVLARVGLYSMSAYDGDEISWTCSCDGYATQSGTHTVDGDATITIRLPEVSTSG